MLLFKVSTEQVGPATRSNFNFKCLRWLLYREWVIIRLTHSHSLAWCICVCVAYVFGIVISDKRLYLYLSFFMCLWLSPAPREWGNVRLTLASWCTAVPQSRAHRCTHKSTRAADTRVVDSRTFIVRSCVLPKDSMWTCWLGVTWGCSDFFVIINPLAGERITCHNQFNDDQLAC